MKQMIADGVIGEVQKVDLQYYHRWINPFMHQPDLRKSIQGLDPDKGGLAVIGDIGTHAFDMVEYVTGMRVIIS